MPPPPVTSPTRSANCGLCISESALGSLSVLLLRYIIQLKRGGLSLILFAVSTAPWASIYDIHRQLYFNPFPLLPATTFTGLLPDINSCLVLRFYSPAKPLAGGKEGARATTEYSICSQRLKRLGRKFSLVTTKCYPERQPTQGRISPFPVLNCCNSVYNQLLAKWEGCMNFADVTRCGIHTTFHLLLPVHPQNWGISWPSVWTSHMEAPLPHCKAIPRECSSALQREREQSCTASTKNWGGLRKNGAFQIQIEWGEEEEIECGNWSALNLKLLSAKGLFDNLR